MVYNSSKKIGWASQSLQFTIRCLLFVTLRFGFRNKFGFLSKNKDCSFILTCRRRQCIVYCYLAHKNHHHIQQHHFQFSCFYFYSFSEKKHTVNAAISFWLPVFKQLFLSLSPAQKKETYLSRQASLNWILLLFSRSLSLSPSTDLYLNYYLAHFVCEFHLQLHAALNKVKIDSNARIWFTNATVCAWIKGKK